MEVAAGDPHINKLSSWKASVEAPSINQHLSPKPWFHYQSYFLGKVNYLEGDIPRYFQTRRTAGGFFSFLPFPRTQEAVGQRGRSVPAGPGQLLSLRRAQPPRFPATSLTLPKASRLTVQPPPPSLSSLPPRCHLRPRGWGAALPALPRLAPPQLSPYCPRWWSVRGDLRRGGR